jgi:hypothetical protein
MLGCGAPSRISLRSIRDYEPQSDWKFIATPLMQ